MKSISPFTLALFLFCSLATAQPYQQLDDWYPGIVILRTDEVIRADISFDPASNLVMCQKDGKLYTYGPHQAVSFQYYNEQDGVLHKFEVFSEQVNSYYSRDAFFEIVVDGDVPYLRKRNRFPVYQPRDGYLAERTITPHAKAYDYFVELDGSLSKAKRFKKEVLPHLLQAEASLAGFIKDKRLKVYDIGDQIVLLNYYNRKAETVKATANTLSDNKGAD